MSDILRYRAKAAIQICRRIQYESGDKCGKHLARALYDQWVVSYVPQVLDPSGLKVTLPKYIAQSFGDYYSPLYNLPGSSQSQVQMDDNLASSHLPRLSSPQRQELETPIILEEVQAAMSLVKPSKAPGPDGFTVQYCKTLSPHGEDVQYLREILIFPTRDPTSPHFSHTRGKGPLLVQ